MLKMFLVPLLVLFSSLVFAEGTIDTTAVVSSISGVGTALTAIGAAILALAALAIGFKWAKAMIFG